MTAGAPGAVPWSQMAEAGDAGGEDSAELTLEDLEEIAPRPQSPTEPPRPVPPPARPAAPVPPRPSAPPPVSPRAKGLRPRPTREAPAVPPPRRRREGEPGAVGPDAGVTEPSEDAFVALCEAQQRDEPDPERRARLQFEIGRAHLAAGDPERALEAFEAALASAPAHLGALRALRRIHEELGQWPELIALLDRELAVTGESARRGELLRRKAELLDERLGDPEAATEAYQAVLAVNPADLVALKGLERLYTRAGAWQRLAEVYGRLARVVTDSRLRATWLARQARLSEARLGDPHRALRLYEAAAREDPVATTALVHVKRLAFALGELDRAIHAMRAQLERTRDARARRELHTAIASALERADDLDGAVEACRGALAEDPSDGELLERLAALHAARGEWAQEAETLAQLVSLAARPSEAARLAHRLAAVHLQRLEDREEARAWLARAFDADPRFEPAAQELCAQLQAAQDWVALVAVLARRAEVSTDPRVQAQLLYRVGLLFEERLGRPEDATDRYARVLAIDPDHAQAFEALCRLHATAGRWPELADLYRRAVDRAPHSGEASAWLTRLGNLLEDRLDDPTAALQVYERLLALDPTSLGAQHAVQRAAARAGRDERLVEALRAEAALTKDAGRRDALLHRAARVELDRLADRAGARRALQAILEGSPNYVPALETLSLIEAAAGRWDALRSLYERRVACSDDREERARLRFGIGELEERRLGRPDAAVASYREALREDPGFTAARDALWRVLERTEAWSDLAAELAAALEGTGEPSQRAALAVRLGQLQEHRLGDPAAALAAYERAAQADPRHRVALDARFRLLVEAEEWGRLALALAEEAEASPDAYLGGQVALERTLVEVRSAPDSEARDHAASYLRAHPEFVGAIGATEELGLRLSDSSALSAAYARLAGASSDEAAVLAALGELLRLRRERGEPLSPVLQRVARLRPDDPECLEQLALEASRDGDVEAELRALERLAGLSRDPSLSADDHYRLGRARLDGGDAPGALQAFRAAVAQDGRDLGARRGLSLAARALGDAAALLEAARGERDVTRDRPLAVRLFLDAAEAFVATGQEERAAACYAEALEAQPDSPEAAMGLMATLMHRDGVPFLIERLAHASRSARDPSRAAALHLCVAQLQAELQDDLPAAIASVRQALVHSPAHRWASRQLADYLERSEQWTAAVETLEASLPRLAPNEQVQIRLRVAAIREQHLLDFDGAAADLRAVLARRDADPAALSALARVERLRGNDVEALALVRRLLGIVADDRDRAAALAELAEIERERGAFPEAAAAALEAIAIEGPVGLAGEVFRALSEVAPEACTDDAYPQALGRFLSRAGTPRAHRAVAYRELARTSERSRGGVEFAIATLQRGTEELPDDSSVSLALVGALRRAGRDAEALDEARRLIAFDAREPAAWRAASAILSARGDGPGAARALAPLVASKQASAEEEGAVAARPAQVAALGPRALSAGNLARLFGPGTFGSPWASYLPATAEIVAKLEGVDYARWGVSKRDRLRPGDSHPVRVLADRVAAIFGDPEFDLFVLEGDRYRHGFVLAGSPPAVLIPSTLARATPAALAFELARPIGLVARQAAALDHVEDERLERILVALARHFEPSFALGVRFDQDELDALEAETQRVGKAIGFFGRGRVQEAAQRLAAAAPAPLGPWARAVRLEASKAALLVADDLLAVTATLGEAIGPDNEATELARFWISEPALRFRRVLGQLS